MREEKKGALGNQTGVFLGPFPNLFTMAAGGGSDLVGLLKPPPFKLFKGGDTEQTLQDWNKYIKQFLAVTKADSTHTVEAVRQQRTFYCAEKTCVCDSEDRQTDTELEDRKNL